MKISGTNQNQIMEASTMRHDFKPGDHLRSPRIGHSHHGIYIGEGQVIHYSGFDNGIQRGCIAIASLPDFSRGNAIQVVSHPQRIFDGEETVQRAHTRLGEDLYNLLLNNCEHFVHWCIFGIPVSHQVNNLAMVAMAGRSALGIKSAETTAAMLSSATSGTAIRSCLTSFATTTGFIGGGAGAGAAVAAGSGLATSAGMATAGFVGGAAATTMAPLLLTMAAGAGLTYAAKSAFDWLCD